MIAVDEDSKRLEISERPFFQGFQFPCRRMDKMAGDRRFRYAKIAQEVIESASIIPG